MWRERHGHVTARTDWGHPRVHPPSPSPVTHPHFPTQSQNSSLPFAPLPGRIRIPSLAHPLLQVSLSTPVPHLRGQKHLPLSPTCTHTHPEPCTDTSLDMLTHVLTHVCSGEGKAGSRVLHIQGRDNPQRGLQTPGKKGFPALQPSGAAQEAVAGQAGVGGAP